MTTTPVASWAHPLAALLSTTFLIVWKYAGLYMLILLVGLQAIPPDVYEAAAVDGASRRQTFRRITLPLLRPSLALALILCVTGSLLAFDQFYILTKGGPENSTVTVVQLIYREAFQRQEPGHGGRHLDRRAGRCCWSSTRSSSAGSRGTARRSVTTNMRLHRALGQNALLRGHRRPGVIFLFPLLWAAVASVSPRAAPARSRLRPGQLRDALDFGSGLPPFLLNSVIVSGLTVSFTFTCRCSAGTPSPGSRSRAERAVPG